MLKSREETLVQSLALSGKLERKLNEQQYPNQSQEESLLVWTLADTCLRHISQPSLCLLLNKENQLVGRDRLLQSGQLLTLVILGDDCLSCSSLESRRAATPMLLSNRRAMQQYHSGEDLVGYREENKLWQSVHTRGFFFKNKLSRLFPPCPPQDTVAKNGLSKINWAWSWVWRHLTRS